MSTTIEGKAAGTILQRPKQVTVGEKTFSVAPPSTATLILVSELVAKMPAVKIDTDNILTETLRIAKDCGAIGDILAVLIIGAKEILRERRTEKRKLLGFIPWFQKAETNRQAWLAETILHELSPKQVSELTIKLLSDLEISDFFGFTTSLIEINLTQATREVVKMTASGL